MKLSINKLLIGLLFVFSLVLIPAGVAKANSYSVSCGTENGQGQWVDFDLNVSPVADLMAAEASGGVTSGSGASYDGYHCPYNISVTAHSDEDSREKTIFSGYTPNNPGGSMVFLFNTGGWHTIVFSGYVYSNMPRQFGPVSMTTRIVKPFVPPAPDPTVTVSATGVNPATAPSNPLSIPYNTGVNIRWYSTNANSCSCTYNGVPNDCTPTGNTVGTAINPVGALNNPYTLAQSKTFSVTCSN